MKRVRLRLAPGGVHPVFELLTTSPHVERAAGIHRNVADDGTLTMLHRIVGVELGYFDVPRRASHEDVARVLECSPSTAAEPLQKAQSKIVRGAIGPRNGVENGR